MHERKENDLEEEGLTEGYFYGNRQIIWAPLLKIVMTGRQETMGGRGGGTIKLRMALTFLLEN